MLDVGYFSSRGLWSVPRRDVQTLGAPEKELGQGTHSRWHVGGKLHAPWGRVENEENRPGAPVGSTIHIEGVKIG